MAFRHWFPRSLQEQAVFTQNFTNVFREIAVSLNFTQADIAKLEKDNAVLQYLAQMDVFLRNYKKSFQKLRDDLTGGKAKAEAKYTSFVPPTEPPIVPYGIFDRIFFLSDRIVAAENYTTVIGAQLGILSKPSAPMRAAETKPKIKARPLSGARLEVSFVRGKTDGICLYIRRMGSEDWTEINRFFYSPAVVEIQLTEAGKPEQIEVRGRHLKGNDPFGNISDSVIMIIMP